MKASVLGCGRWGSFIAWYLSQKYDTVIWGREGSENIKQLSETRCNGVVTLGDRVNITTDLAVATENDTVFISISAQQLSDLAEKLCRIVPEGSHKRFVLCMKGIEETTGRRLTEVFDSVYTKPHTLAVWLGPGHVEDFVRSIPNCMVIDSEDEGVKHELVAELSSPLIRFYLGTDIIGNELGAASKNVIGIAAGMLDGLELSSLKGALMARGTVEISRLIHAMGGDRMSAFGLCHLGDYEATVFSKHSHNRAYGEAFVRGERFDKLAEGVSTCRAIMLLAERYGVDMPICTAVYNTLNENADPGETLNKLFSRNIKSEFDGEDKK